MSYAFDFVNQAHWYLDFSAMVKTNAGGIGGTWVGIAFHESIQIMLVTSSNVRIHVGFTCRTEIPPLTCRRN